MRHPLVHLLARLSGLVVAPLQGLVGAHLVRDIPAHLPGGLHTLLLGHVSTHWVGHLSLLLLLHIPALLVRVTLASAGDGGPDLVIACALPPELTVVPVESAALCLCVRLHLRPVLLHTHILVQGLALRFV